MWTEFNSICQSATIQGYGNGYEHYWGPGILGDSTSAKCRFSYGGYIKFECNHSHPCIIQNNYTSGSDIAGHTHRHRFVTSDGTEIRWDSALGLEIQTKIQAIYTPMYLEKILAEYKASKLNLENSRVGR